VSVTPLRDPDGGPITYVHVARDFTEHKKLEEKLRSMATTDGLTGLYNLRYFRALAGREVDRARRYGHTLSLMILDLDRFKGINDRYGHDMGDRVLQRIAEIGRANLRESDIFARLGGDEFAVLLPETDLWEALVVAERLRREVSRSVVSAERGTARFTISVGIAEAGEEGPDLERLMKDADAALYSAKAGGRNRVEVTRGLPR
jgi:diguanylate cyclase (GGDEF)-like protein